MKKLIKIILIILAVFLILLIILPVIFKKPIMNKVTGTLNDNLNARVEFTDFSLSLLRHFPDLNIRLEGLSVTGTGTFEKDTLLKLAEFNVNVDVISAIKMENIKVKSVLLDQPVIHAIIKKSGEVNWDITKPSAEPVTTDTSESAMPEFKIDLKKFEIQNGYISYMDDSSNMEMRLEGLNFLLSGNLANDFTTLNINSTIQSIDFRYEGIPYLKKAGLKATMNIDADMVNSYYVLKDNQVSLNDLLLKFDGTFSIPNDSTYDVDMKFNTTETSFKSILSMVPAVYLQDFQDVQTNGQFTLSGYAKGLYNSYRTPSAGLKLTVENAMFKYPDLPKAAQNININMSMFYDGAEPDNSTLDIDKFHIEMAGNPVDFQLNLKTPVSDPNINARLQGKIDFASLADVVPLEDATIKGLLEANIDMMGNLSSIEQEKYQDFKADGNMSLTGFEYKSSGLPQNFTISNAILKFSPKYVDLTNFDARIGNSDLQLTGSIVDFLPYMLADGTIKGDFKFNSHLLDINELLSQDTVSTAEEADTAALTVFEVPANVDFILSSSIDQLKYDNFDINNVNGTVEIKEQQVLLKNLRMNLLEGSMVMNGTYSTVDITKPSADFDLSINRFDIPAAFNTFTTIQKFVPIAKNATGRFSSDLTFRTLLGPDMMPVLSSINASGKLTSDQIAINQSATLTKLSEALNTDKYKTLTLNNLNLSFEIKDGRISVSPFETHLGNTDFIIAGDQGLDQTMNFIISMNIPRSVLGGSANKLISELTSKASAKGVTIEPGQTISLDALVGGTVTDPKVSLNIKESLGSAKEMIKNQVKEQISQKTEEIKTEAKQKVSAEAQKIIAQAEQEAEKIKEAAAKAADAVREQANANADKIISEAADKPKFAKDIAKKAADKVRKEGEDKASKIINEANQKADSVIQKAKDEAAKLDE